MFQAAARRSPDTVLLRYFDAALTMSEVDEISGALAAALVDRGFRVGDRTAVYLQNVPQFVLAMLGIWKAGGIMVPINPMNRERELEVILNDAGASTLVCEEMLYRDVAAAVLPKTSVRSVLTTSPLDYVTDPNPRVFGDMTRCRADGVDDLLEVAAEFRGRTPPADAGLRPDDTAFLVYTSGTTGPPKGAMNTHRNVVFNAQAYRDWMRLTPDDVVLGIAPLFHITGLIGHIALATLLPCPLVLAYRFEPEVILQETRDKGATFTIGAITAFIALLNAPGAAREHLATLGKIYSGGAPIPPSTVASFRDLFGQYIHNIYGLTETTSPSHAAPLDRPTPVDPDFGALSVGVPVPGHEQRVVDLETGAEVEPGELGELWTRGPGIVAGYWQRPEATAESITDGFLHTGDVGRVDEAGWFYLVDRLKDMINVSGYKVWPR
ncbi:MAG: class I adenylate-forming enzyme family protein, partial [Solirubrobacteraceae bacterium]